VPHVSKVITTTDIAPVFALSGIPRPRQAEIKFIVHVEVKLVLLQRVPLQRSIVPDLVVQSDRVGVIPRCSVLDKTLFQANPIREPTTLELCSEKRLFPQAMLVHKVFV
jgi:hypothetical protein